MAAKGSRLKRGSSTDKPNLIAWLGLAGVALTAAAGIIVAIINHHPTPVPVPTPTPSPTNALLEQPSVAIDSFTEAALSPPPGERLTFDGTFAGAGTSPQVYDDNPLGT